MGIIALADEISTAFARLSEGCGKRFPDEYALSRHGDTLPVSLNQGVAVQVIGGD
jgi:hypothetical protein